MEIGKNWFNEFQRGRTSAFYRDVDTADCVFDALSKRNPKEFPYRLVTVNGTWIRWHTPGNNERSKQWTYPIESALKEIFLSPVKVLATGFWYSQGVSYITYLKEGKTTF